MKNSLRRLKGTCVEILKNFTQIVESKHPDLEFHSSRVVVYAIATAQEMGLSKEEVKIIEYAGYLHDIGKIGISELILLKPGSLTDEEWTEMRKHPEIGEKIIRPFRLLYLEQPAIRHHHERLDGKGYPDGLSKGKIPIEARILAVADAYDSMTSRRPYRDALGPAGATEELKKCKGTQFDPGVVDVFLKVVEKANVRINQVLSKIK